MDILMVENPGFGKLVFSKNRIEKNIEAASLTIEERSKLRYYLTIEVPPYPNAAEWVALPIMDAIEDPVEEAGGAMVAKGAFFEIQNILHSLVKPAVPVWGQDAILPVPELVMPFRCNSVVKNDGVEVEGTNNGGGIEYVIRAGLNENHYEEWKDGFFDVFLKKGFLTWKPSRIVMPGEPVFLYWLNNMIPTPQALKLRVFRWYSDGTEDVEPATVLVQNTQYMNVYSVPVGLDIVGPADKEVKKYMVWLVNEENRVVSEMVTFVVDRENYEDVRFVLFRNSLGGYDTLPIAGSVIDTLKVAKDVSEIYRPFGSKASFSETVINEVTGTRELILNTGWLTKEERDWLQELAVSEDVYLVTDREFIPMLLMDEAYVNYDTKEDLIGRTFVFEYCNKESNYSRLPVKEPGAVRATGWRAYGYGACELDGFGKRTGRAYVTHLEKYYPDDNTSVKPLNVKLNDPGTEGYIDPVVNAGCATTPHTNLEYAALGTFKKTGCAVGFYGTKAMITIPEGRWGSEDSQDDANKKAEAEWTVLNTQAYANANAGPCVAVSAAGLNGKYWNWSNNATQLPPESVFSSTPIVERIDGVIDIGAIEDGLSLVWPAGLSTNYAVYSRAAQWTGFVKAAYTGLVTIRLENNRGVRMWIDGTRVINFWENQTESNLFEAQVQMVADQFYAIKVEFFKYGHYGAVSMKWSWDGQAVVVVPSTRLFHE